MRTETEGAASNPAANTQPAATAPSSADRTATYAAAIAEVNAYLSLWAKAGPYAAAHAYLVADEQLPSLADTGWRPTSGDPQTPVLVAGSVVSYIPWQWTSAQLAVLHVHRTRCIHPYRMYHGSGP